jgi:hypothetical protein
MFQCWYLLFDEELLFFFARGVQCHDLKCTFVAKDLIFLMNSAVNFPQFGDKLLGC